MTNTPSTNENENISLFSIRSATDDTARNSRYLQELMQELQMMTKLYENNNSAKFRNANNLLLREIQRVWAIELSDSTNNNNTATNQQQQQQQIGDQKTPEKIQIFSPIPVKDRQKSNGDRASPPSSSKKAYSKETKLYLPDEDETNSNLVGRLIGPRGMTIRQLENDYDCNLYIRGKGCMRDHEKEEKLRGRNGWQHLDDKIHVLIVSKGDTEQICETKLEAAKTRIENLFNNPNDTLKKGQLVQLAIIEGTLRE